MIFIIFVDVVRGHWNRYGTPTPMTNLSRPVACWLQLALSVAEAQSCSGSIAICISGFVDCVMFSYYGPNGDVSLLQ